MKLRIFLLFVIGFLLINFFSLKVYFFNVLGNVKYNNLDFTGSIELFKKANNFEGVYNSANSYYKLGNFNEAKKLYNNINCEDSKKCSISNFNLGNTNYRLSKKENDIEKKKNLLQSAISNYTDSLKIDYKPEVEKNLEFVLNELKILKNLTNSKNQDKNNGQDSNLNDSGNNNTQKDGNKNNGVSGTGSSDSSDNGDSGSNQQLSNDQKSAIEKYAKSLQQGQKDYGQYYNKNYQESNNPFDSFDAFFGNNSFFDNSLLEENNNVKDW